MSGQFDLVIGFIGSAACNPVLAELMKLHFDPRFFFSEWKPEVIQKLLDQQERLGANRRNVLLLVDDIIMSGKQEDQLNHMAMRGRHFGISIMMCAVSYTTLPKKTRRSLDVLLVYSLPMQGDMKIMTWEFAHKNSMAEHVLKNLGEHEALVLETLQRRQELFIWKADLLTLQPENATSPEHEKSKIEPSSGTPPERRTPPRQTETSESQTRTRSAESAHTHHREL